MADQQVAQDEIEEHEPPLHSDKEDIIERLVFNNRGVILILLSLFTCYMVYHMVQVRPNASFEKMIPLEHPYIQNMMFNFHNLPGANNVDIAVAVKEGDIFTKEYMETLAKIHDTVFYLPQVNRGGLRSLWSANVRWVAVTEDGFQGGAVIPAQLDGWSRENLEELRQNILRSGQVGRIVANNYKSSIVQAPLLPLHPKTGQPIDYRVVNAALEEIREKFQDGNIEVKIIGFAKKIGDLIKGAAQVGVFFLGALAITSVLMFFYSGCWKSTLVTVSCSFLAVVWQLGLIHWLGYGIDPYSMLIPFLVFAIGISHGVQLVGAMAIETVESGGDKLLAAKYAFRGLFVAGAVALASDAFGFTTLLLIEIQVIQELAIAATVGISVILFTNLLLLPILMSYIGVSKAAIKKTEYSIHHHSKLWGGLSYLVHPMVVPVSMVIGLLGFAGGMWYGQFLKIGDLDPGAPELWPDSTYNLDNAYITENYSVSSDVFVVMVATKEQQCLNYDVVEAVDRLEWHILNVDGVQQATSLAGVSKSVGIAKSNGNPRWFGIPRNQTTLFNNVPDELRDVGLFNGSCDFIPVIFFLEDHKAATLERVVDAVKEFQSKYNPTAEEQVKIDQCKAAKEAELRPSFIEDMEKKKEGFQKQIEDARVNEGLSAEDKERIISGAELKLREAPKQMEYDLYRAVFNECDTTRFMLAAASSGVEAATNEEIAVAQTQMLILVYSVVSFMVLLTFRSLAAVVSIIVPLYLTSVLCNALMVFLGMGVKVATLPVIAVGVGIGVDYGIYVYTRLKDFLEMGMSMQEAYYNTLKTTGKAVVFTAVTLAIGVGTWAWSPIKFQADMGILLTFMFVWNMVGALTLLPGFAKLLLNPEKMAKQDRVKAAETAGVKKQDW